MRILELGVYSRRWTFTHPGSEGLEGASGRLQKSHSAVSPEHGAVGKVGPWGK